MRIDSAGNIGIGTTSPSDVLHIEGNSGANKGILVKNSGVGRAILKLDSGGASTTNITLASAGVNKWDILANGANSFAVYDDTTLAYRFLINNIGNV
jgi:hypothetical protein